MPHPENPQMTERTMWAVEYKDGSTLLEYPDPTTHNSFSALVDIDNVVRLELGPNVWLDETGPEFVVPIYPGMRPIFFRQNAINTHTGQHMCYTVIGYQMTVDGRNVQHLTYIPDTNPEAPIVLSPDRLEIG